MRTQGQTTIQFRNSKRWEQGAIPHTEDKRLQTAKQDSSRVRLAQSGGDQVTTAAPCKVLVCGDCAHRVESWLVMTLRKLSDGRNQGWVLRAHFSPTEPSGPGGEGKAENCKGVLGSSSGGQQVGRQCGKQDSELQLPEQRAIQRPLSRVWIPLLQVAESVVHLVAWSSLSSLHRPSTHHWESEGPSHLHVPKTVTGGGGVW